MRILLAHNSLYYPSMGGGDKSNRLLMEELAVRGHQVRVVARVEKFGQLAHTKLLEELVVRDIPVDATETGLVKFVRRKVEVHVLTLNSQLRGYFQEQIAEFDPDVILTSTDDPGQLLFEVAMRAPRARVVHLVRATIAVPFGPDSSMASVVRTEALRRADGVVGVSEYVARYLREFGGIDAIHVPIALMEPGQFPDLARFENPYVSMVNPCAVKGISIFLALAERMPQVQFAAIPVWGTNAADMASLRRHANVAVLAPVENIDELLSRTRIMLVPSLWAEARSRMIPEAMLRGVPVLAANIGGIPEAKLGVDYLLPVNPITHYKAAVDENMVPVAEVPPQDIEPWHAALERLVTDRDHYSELSAVSRKAALEYVAGLSVLPFESYLQEVVQKPQRGRAANDAAKRKLLALRLKQAAARRPAGNLWFSNLSAPGLRLFCFPFAGGGTLLYRSWTERLRAHTAVCPVSLPGREARLNEPAFDDMDALVEVLARGITPLVDRPFAFYGHSMGAAIAFELTRALRRTGQPLPIALFVSAARAPQFRLGHQPQPDPDDADLIDQLRRLEGALAEVPDKPALMQLAMPSLRADTRLYRNYVYRPEEPLAVPIFAYGGSSDPNVSHAQIAAWRDQTSAAFEQAEFPGGHFFISY